MDNDGDIDLFTGNLVNATAYGIPQTSFLLINDGRGNFSIDNNRSIQLANIGMVTSAAFADVNKDGLKDLIVAGEWMPVTIFINRNGKFEKNEIPNSSGLWQTVFIDDVNGDGNIDILAGNWGYNTKFWAGKDGPLRLYVDDFDKNGKMDQLLSYTSNGVEYPFLAKDEVERQLPQLRKHYLLYADYAGVPMKDVYYGWIDTTKPLVAERLGSAVFYGDGKGVFSINDLPSNLQLTPVFSFQKVSNGSSAKKEYLLGGNFFDVLPYEGRYDARPAALFESSKDNVFNFIPQQNLSAIKGQVRDVKLLHTIKYGDVLMLARNNDSIVFLANKK